MAGRQKQLERWRNARSAQSESDYHAQSNTTERRSISRMTETHPVFQPDSTMQLPPMLPAGGTVTAATAALLQPNPYQPEPAMLALSGLGPVMPRSMTVCSVHF